MLPPLDFDVREYHLQAPKEFFQQGQITFLPHNVYANMTLGTEMLSLLAMVVAGDWWLGALAGKTVIAAFTPFTRRRCWPAGWRLFSPAAGVVAALVYISVPWVVSVASGGFVEGASACYLFLAVYAVLLLRTRGRRHVSNWPSPTSRRPFHASYAACCAGRLSAGAAVATKYPARAVRALAHRLASGLGRRSTATGRALKSLGTSFCWRRPSAADCGSARTGC